MGTPTPEEADRRDPGLQPERTRLAWRRTTLSCTVAAVLAVRQALHHGGTGVAVVAASLTALVWLAFLGVAHRRTLALDTARPRPLSVRAAVTAAVCTLCLAAFALTILV